MEGGRPGVSCGDPGHRHLYRHLRRERCQQELGERERPHAEGEGRARGHELQHTRLLAKPGKTEDDWKCIYALRDAMEKARAFEDLLYRQLCHDSTDVAVGSIMTIAGVLTAGSAGTVVGAAYDAASTSVGSERAIKLTNAECAYDVACEQVERACQNRITVNWGELTDAEVYNANKDGLISGSRTAVRRF